MMRPTLNMIPVMIPGIAAGRTTLLMDCQRVAPKARLPSRKLTGTVSSASCVVRMWFGSTRQAPASAAESSEKPNLSVETTRA